ncbi:hypothetical protein IAJ44_004283 [Salmonella enterica]|nr:hypothetical protein [Salmonella enterica]
MRQVKNVQQSYYDPLAQTFMLTEARQLHAVDVFVTTPGTTPLIVQLRETSTGFPTRDIMAEGRVDQSTIAAGTWVTILFDVPFYASANIEYAVVVMANDPTTEVGISELGKVDLGGKGGYVTSQPYQVGVLLSSANASTWTAHQDRDLTFRLRARKYDHTKIKDVPLGTITLPPGTTDLLISAMTNTPATGADAELQLITTDPNNPTQKVTRTVSDGQVIKYNSAISGPMEVRAVLRCTDTASATISPGSQIIAGALQNTGTYVTSDIPIATGAKAMVVTLEYLNVSSIKVEYAEIPVQSSPSSWTWKPLKTVTTAPNQNALTATGHNEMSFAELALAVTQANIKLRITLDGTPAMRPEVFNLRASITETVPKVTVAP